MRGGQPLVYLDSANTSQKPRQVIEAMDEFYERHNANIHRASHQLGEEATEAYEGARIKVGEFIGAPDETEVVFTKNISEAINLVAYSMSNATAAGGPARLSLGPGDEIVITEMEHHSNIVPWQLLCQRTGATLRWFGVTHDGRLDLSDIGDLITERTKLVALAHQSNVLGTINPVRAIADAAHAVGALVLLDGAQAVPHMPVDVAATRRRLLRLHRAQDVRPDRHRRAVGAARAARGDAAVPRRRRDDRERLDGPDHVRPAAAQVRGRHDADRAGGRAGRGRRLPERGRPGRGAGPRAGPDRRTRWTSSAEIDGLRILGPTTSADRGSAISFTVEGVHPHDVSQVLDDLGIAVRAGHHCAWPLHRAFGVQASTRASFYLYNRREEVDALADGIRQAQRFFADSDRRYRSADE